MSETTSSRTRLLQIDLLRVVAMLMVIVLHTWLNFTLRPDFFATKVWFVFEPSVALSKTSVLIFFIISGYLVLDKGRTLKETIYKIRHRLLVPLIFFSLLTVAYNFYRFPFTGDNLDVFVRSELIRMTNSPSSPLWFLGVLTIMYVLNPIWHEFFTPTRKSELALFLQKVTFAYSVITPLVMFPAMKGGTFSTSFTAWLGFLCFYFYGGIIKNKWVNVENHKFNALLILGGLAGTFFLDYLNGLSDLGTINFLWLGYSRQFLCLPVMMMAVGIFNVDMSTQVKWLIEDKMPSFIKSTLSWLAGLSFGIYLIHTFVISLFTDIIGFDFNRLNMNVYLYNALNFVLVLGISILITFILKKTPKLRVIIGE